MMLCLPKGAAVNQQNDTLPAVESAKDRLNMLNFVVFSVKTCFQLWPWTLMLYLFNLMTVSRTTWPMTWHPLKMLLTSSWQTRRPKPRQSPKLLPRWWKDQMLRRSSRSLPSARPHHHQASPGMAIMGYHQLRAHLVVWDAGQRQNVVPIVESQPLKAWGLPTGLSGRHGRMPKIARRSEEQMHFHCWPISFGVRQPIVCQWGYTCPCQWSWKSYLILAANALLFVFNPQHSCFQPTSGLGRTRSIECWQAFAAQVQTNLPQGHQGEWARLMAMKQGAMAMATLTNGTGPLAFHRFQEVGATTGMWTLIRAVHGSATPSKTPC